MKGTNGGANDEYRKTVVDALIKFFGDRGEEVLQTASNKIAFPFVNALNSDEFIEITISVPKGSTKDKTPYDGYEQAEDYKAKVIKDAEAEKAAALKKEADILRDKQKREIAAKKKLEAK